MAYPMEITDDTLDAEVLKSDLPVLMEFWAEWCQPCQTVASSVKDIAAKYEGQIKVVKLDVDYSGLTASEYQIKNVPALLLFKNGQEIDRITECTSKDDITKRIQAVLR